MRPVLLNRHIAARAPLFAYSEQMSCMPKFVHCLYVSWLLLFHAYVSRMLICQISHANMSDVAHKTGATQSRAPSAATLCHVCREMLAYGPCLSAFQTTVSMCLARLAAGRRALHSQTLSMHSQRAACCLEIIRRPEITVQRRNDLRSPAQTAKATVKLRRCESKTCRMQIFGWIRCGDAPCRA